jgi:hypothetical protein
MPRAVGFDSRSGHSGGDQRRDTMNDRTEQIRIAVSKPVSDGAHAIETPVEGIVDDSPLPESRAMILIDDVGAVLTPEQCFRLSDHFNKAGEALKRYHEEHNPNSEK